MPTPIQRRAINTDLNPNWDAAEHSLRCAMEVIDWCQAERINLAGVEARDLDTAMGEMPPEHQSPTDFLDMACALAAVRRLYFGVVQQPQSVNAEMLEALQKIVSEGDFTAPESMKLIARAAITKAQSATQPQSVSDDLLESLVECLPLVRVKYGNLFSEVNEIIARADAVIAKATESQP